MMMAYKRMNQWLFYAYEIIIRSLLQSVINHANESSDRKLQVKSQATVVDHYVYVERLGYW